MTSKRKEARTAASAASQVQDGPEVTARRKDKVQTEELWRSEHLLLRQLLYRFKNEHHGAGRTWFGRVKEVARLVGRIEIELDLQAGDGQAGGGPTTQAISALRLLALLDAVRGSVVLCSYGRSARSI